MNSSASLISSASKLPTRNYFVRQWSARVFSLICAMLLTVSLLPSVHAQVNSGSNGSDGAFNPTTNIVINMADHPDGIYHYTSVNISNGVTVTFIPNANNTPVVWLVQSNCVINGNLDVSGQDGTVAGVGGLAGPGGWAGGNAKNGNRPAMPGQGPGGGFAGFSYGGNASFATVGSSGASISPPGSIYGNNFLVPLLGGSGGGGSDSYLRGGGGGGGAFLIAASGTISISGNIRADGGSSSGGGGGSGSGGSVRVVAITIIGTGGISASGGYYYGTGYGGSGRVRFDSFQNTFAGAVSGAFTSGYQPIIIPTAGQGAQLNVTSIGGVPVSATPNGVLAIPDAVLSAQQNNPIPLVVQCTSLPLNTQITVSVKPANGATVSAVGYNNTGTVSNSTATVMINIPRGGGLIYATAATSN